MCVVLSSVSVTLMWNNKIKFMYKRMIKCIGLTKEEMMKNCQIFYICYYIKYFFLSGVFVMKMCNDCKSFMIWFYYLGVIFLPFTSNVSHFQKCISDSFGIQSIYNIPQNTSIFFDSINSFADRMIEQSQINHANSIIIINVLSK